MSLPSGEQILRDWLAGTTCFRRVCKRTVLLESETHVVLKHGSHTSYVDRTIGNSTCGAYANLYAKSQFTKADSKHKYNLYYSGEPLRTWEGSISKKKILADCKAMGIVLGEL